MFMTLLRSNNSRRVCVCGEEPPRLFPFSRPARVDVCPLPSGAAASSLRQYLFIWPRLFTFFMFVEKHYERLISKPLTGLTLLIKKTLDLQKKEPIYSSRMWASPATDWPEIYWVYIWWHHQAHCEMKKCVSLKVSPNGLWKFGWQRCFS